VTLGEQPPYTFVVDSGCLTADTVLAGGRRQVLLILYPGDSISGSTAPMGVGVGLTAVVPSVLTRLSAEALEAAAFGAVRRAELYDAQARMMARSMLHAAAIGRLTSEERFAALMLEMAHHLGQPTPGGCTFELPLSRADMADYLALNPDTLSRLVSRLRARDILHMPSRRRVIVQDIEALSGLCPLAKALASARAGEASVVKV
jgi:CRP/FNR family transcriptional regulator